MRVMITGAGGMVGTHMVDYFAANGICPIGTYYKPTVNIAEVRSEAELIECDVRYFTNVFDIIQHVKPDRIFHLAAQSYPSVSWDKPQETMEINATGTINIFESIRRIRKEEPAYNPMVVVACSSAEYGNSLQQCDGAVKENTPLLPLHPYGVSKVCQDLISYQYYVNFGIRTIRARIFNTTGPRKVNDVCADFTKRVVLMEKQGLKRGILKTGNLETKRAITDVRDLVLALVELAERGTPGEVYNISGSTVYQMSEIVDMIRRHTKLDFKTEIDPSLLRPTDEKIICGDSTKLIAATGWQQHYTLENTITDMLEYWRKVL